MQTTLTLQEEETIDKVDWRLWLKLFSYARPYRRTLAGLIVTSIVLAAADATLTLVPRGLFNDLSAYGADANLMPWILMYAALSGVFCASVWAFVQFGGKIWTYVAHDIRSSAFARLQELSFSYYDRRATGWLMARMTSDCTKLTRIMAWGTMEVIWGICFFIGLTIIMFMVHVKLALLVLVVIPPLAWLSVIFQKRILLASRRARKANSALTASYSEAIGGVRTTKTLVRERENLDEFQQLAGDMYDASVRTAIYSAIYLPLVMTVGSVGIGLALWYGGFRVAEGGMRLGDMILFINIAVQMGSPIQQLARQFTQLQAARASAERIMELLETKPEIQDSPEVRAAIDRHRQSPPAQGLAEDGLPDRIQEVRFEHVRFAYKDGQTVLDNFSLTVTAGQTIALVGPTGGGKTTVVSLLCRFYEPQFGRILIDGIDYRERSLKWLQSNLGIVLQTPHLFSGTIRENIAYGRLDASEEEIEEAARLVNAHDFILAMANGYDTEVGEGGGNLSMGQRQLISFARAVLADPKIFVMDEATSSVDTEAEQLIQRGLHSVLSGRISFVIAHRLSTIKSADVIVVIDGGRIIERGTHHDLIAAKGRYYELYTQQFTRQKEDEILG